MSAHKHDHEFRVWAPDIQERPDRPNAFGNYADSAAADWLRRKWESLDSPNEIDVKVEFEDGRVEEYVIVAVPNVTFMAGKRRTRIVQRLDSSNNG